MRITNLANSILSKFTGLEFIRSQTRNNLNTKVQNYKLLHRKYKKTKQQYTEKNRENIENTRSIKKLQLKNRSIQKKLDAINPTYDKQLDILLNSYNDEKRIVLFFRNLAKLHPEIKTNEVIKLIDLSQGQLGQDLFVISQLGLRPGFFVEFGATNGKSLSNTYLLETGLGWQGILAEPGRIFTDDLKKNRTAKIDNRCVWKESGHRLKFIETRYSDLSTLDIYKDADFHSKSRHKPKDTYEVETVSLDDLLSYHNAPSKIDYMSIDTEGSELDIISSFDFNKYDISIITCEHNFTENRDKIKDILEKNGYRRVFEGLTAFDDWFVKE